MDKSSRKLKPEVTSAKLRSDGYHTLTFTPHVWKESRLIEVPEKRGGTSLAVEHMFQCLKTGTVRRFGLDETDGYDLRGVVH